MAGFSIGRQSMQPCYTFDMSEEVQEQAFEGSRKEARRAAWALNSLVVLSALAGAFFFGYVLHNVWPRGNGVPPIDIPVSTPGAKVGILTAEHDGVTIELRDVDEAPEYRDELSEVMRRDLGIQEAGRLYLLVVRNTGEETYSFSPGSLTASDKHGKKWTVRWLDEVASKESANTVGRMRMAQSAHRFELAKSEERHLYVFIQSADSFPPTAEDLVSGVLKNGSAEAIKLEHTEVKVAER